MKGALKKNIFLDQIVFADFLQLKLNFFNRHSHVKFPGVSRDVIKFYVLQLVDTLMQSESKEIYVLMKNFKIFTAIRID